MNIGLSTRAGGRPSPLTVLAGALVVVGLIGLWRARSDDPIAATGPTLARGCSAPNQADCAPTGTTASQTAASLPASPVLTAAEACRNVGYLCADLASQGRIRLHRWKDFSGTIVVHIPRPDFESPGDAVRLQQAATQGLRAWNSQPFEIMTDLRGDRSPHFAVRWSQTLPRNQIGVARTQWSSALGLTVVAIELATRSPYNSATVIDPAQLRLTAAHEMGHVLGLPHSNSSRDVMYPTNTATSLTAQDYRTMEALYSLPDGTEITR